MKAMQAVNTTVSFLSAGRSHNVLVCARFKKVEKKRQRFMTDDGRIERECSKLERITKLDVATNDRAAAATEARVR